MVARPMTRAARWARSHPIEVFLAASPGKSRKTVAPVAAASRASRSHAASMSRALKPRLLHIAWAAVLALGAVKTRNAAAHTMEAFAISSATVAAVHRRNVCTVISAVARCALTVAGDASATSWPRAIQWARQQIFCARHSAIEAESMERALVCRRVRQLTAHIASHTAEASVAETVRLWANAAAVPRTYARSR